MVSKGQKIRFAVSTKLDKNADKSFKELSVSKMQRSIDNNLSKCKYNQESLRNYYSHLKSSGLSIITIESRIKTLRYAFNCIKKDVKDIERNDIEKFLADGWKEDRVVIYTNGNKIKKKMKEWSPATNQVYKLNILYFYIWFSKVGKYDRLPENVDWIKRKKILRENIKDILTRDEVNRILKNTLCLRDKCIITILHDAGLRVSELAGLKIKDVKEDSYGIVLDVFGKTGARQVRLVDGVPVLKQWINEHPFKNDKDKALFIGLRNAYGRALMGTGIYKIVMGAVKRAGVNKKVHPHLFRHTKLTELAQEGFNEMDLRVFAGWSKSSTMPEVYLHIGAKELDEKIRRKNGMLTKDEESNIEEDKKILKPKTCPMCKESNDVNNKFCSKCGQILDIKVIKDIEDTKEAMVDMIVRGGMKEQLVNRLKVQILRELKQELGMKN